MAILQNPAITLGTIKEISIIVLISKEFFDDLVLMHLLDELQEGPTHDVGAHVDPLQGALHAHNYKLQCLLVVMIFRISFVIAFVTSNLF